MSDNEMSLPLRWQMSKVTHAHSCAGSTAGVLSWIADRDETGPVIVRAFSPTDPKSLGFGGLRVSIQCAVKPIYAEMCNEIAMAVFSLGALEGVPSIYFEFLGTDSFAPRLGTHMRLCEVNSTSVVYELVRNISDFKFRSVQMLFPPNFSALISSVVPTQNVKELVLSTGSPVKLAQYSFLFRASGFAIRGSKFQHSPSEPQVEGYGNREEEILVREPLKHLARFAEQGNVYPLVLEDTMLFVEHFNSDYDSRPILPGPDTKRWWSALGSEGLLRLMQGSNLRRAVFVCQLGLLIGKKDYRVFRAERRGVIANEVRQPLSDSDFFPYVIANNFHNIFIPEGSTKTYSEMLPGEFREHDYRSACVQSVSAFLRKPGSASLKAPLRLF